MPDGKLHIKGTITIKSGKGNKTTKKKRKQRKKKTTTEPYTGVPLGTAQTRQEFGQPAYTAAAVMSAMALRGPQIQQAPIMEQSQVRQQTIEQPKYYSIEDFQRINSEDVIAIPKGQIQQRVAPLLLEAQQQGIRQGEEEIRYLQQQREEEERINKEQKQELEKQLESQVYDTQIRMQYIHDEFQRKQQYFEDETERMHDAFRQELQELELEAKTEKQRMQLERAYDKSELLSESAMDKALFNVMSASQKSQLKKQQEELKKSKEELKVLGIQSEIERINSLSTAQLRQQIKQVAPSFLFDEKGNYLSTDDYRLILLDQKGLVPYTKQVPQSASAGRPTVRYEYQQPQIKESVEQFVEE